MKKIVSTFLLAIVMLSSNVANSTSELNYYAQIKKAEQLEIKVEINDKLKQLVSKYNAKGYAIGYHE